MIKVSDKIYANALVQLGESDKVAKNLEIIQKILTPELNEVLINPAVAEDIKYSIIEDIFKRDVDKKMVEFLKILVSKKRFGDFETIAAAFNAELDKINDVKRIEIVSAVDLDAKTKKNITEKLKGKLGGEIKAQWTTEEEIIAGLVIKIEDDVIDTSLRTQLESLKRNIM
jgi:F-type H+-transporting ATPase subunit delta